MFALVPWVARRLAEQEEAEKAAMLSGTDSGDETTTMDEEIASFRAAADVVGAMVAAEEGRAAAASQTAVLVPVPPRPRSPDGAFAHFAPRQSLESEGLPPYEEEDNTSDASSLVADGLRYTPGSSEYTPSAGSRSDAGELDALLGDTKH